MASTALDELQRRIRETLAESIADINNAESVAEVFRAMIHDGGDALDMAELKGALEVMQISVSELECAALFDSLDADKSGTIDVDEFLRFVSRE